MYYLIKNMNQKYEKELTLRSKEIIKVDIIPLCSKCLIEIDKGKYICQQCKINLCSYHAYEHSQKEKGHEFILLQIK